MIAFPANAPEALFTAKSLAAITNAQRVVIGYLITRSFLNRKTPGERGGLWPWVPDDVMECRRQLTRLAKALGLKRLHERPAPVRKKSAKSQTKKGKASKKRSAKQAA